VQNHGYIQSLQGCRTMFAASARTLETVH